MAQTKQERIAELQTLISDLDTAMANLRKGGQNYQLISSSGGGSQRMFTGVDYETLRQQRKEAKAELDGLQKNKGFRINAGW